MSLRPLVLAPLLAFACGSSAETVRTAEAGQSPTTTTSVETESEQHELCTGVEVSTWDEIIELQEQQAGARAEGVPCPSQSDDVESDETETIPPQPELEVELRSYERHVGRWVDAHDALDESILPNTTYGVPGSRDPFERDLLLQALHEPHDSEEFARDPWIGEHEGELNGRPVFWQPWYLNHDADPVGFEILFDQSPDYVVFARTRSLSIEEALELVGSANVDSETGATLPDPGKAGLAPIITDTNLQWADGEEYWDLKEGIAAGYSIDGQDEYGDLNIWLLDGDEQDINRFRFLGVDETIVPVRGTNGYLLESVKLKWNHDSQPVLVWQEDADQIGIATVDNRVFGSYLPTLADQFDETGLD